MKIKRFIKYHLATLPMFGKYAGPIHRAIRRLMRQQAIRKLKQQWQRQKPGLKLRVAADTASPAEFTL